MTIEELVEKLSKFPDNLEVKILDLRKGYIPINVVDRSEVIEQGDKDFIWLAN